VAHHAFTTRELELPAGGPFGGDGWSRLAAIVGVETAQLATLTQVHGAHVVRVPEEANGPTAIGTWADGDGLITDRPDLALAVKVADCVPILMADRRTGAVAAVHAGWRGTAAAMASAAVHELIRAYGVRPSDVVAAIGPSIGPCCCEVGTDVCDRFLEAGTGPRELAEWFSVVPKAPQVEGLGLGHEARSAGRAGRPGKLWLDTWRANADQLAAAGVPRAQVHISGLCTACYPDRLHSYRVQGTAAGRMAGVIRRVP
jgi:YfiH family protein